MAVHVPLCKSFFALSSLFLNLWYDYRVKVRDQLLKLIGERDVSDRRLSMLATGSTDTVRNIRRGSSPRTDTLEALCAVLGVKIHLGPPQDDTEVSPTLPASSPADGEKGPLPPTPDSEPPEAPAPPEILHALGLAAGATLQDAVRAIDRHLSGETLRDEIVRALKSETRALRDEIRAQRAGPSVADDLTDDQALSAPGTSPEIRALPGTRPVAVHRLQAAAGGGALDLDETVKSYAYFRHEWLSRQGLVADRCSIIGVMGESMEPTLPEGCVVLLDRNRQQRREGRIFVLRTEEGLVVKRAGKDTGGDWQLVSDHPRWPDVPWPGDAAIIGEVRWMARKL